jgi:SnoaL-like domain
VWPVNQADARRNAVTADLDARIRRLEDRAQISEQVIRYAMAVDRRDWAMLGRCFTDPVHADFTEAGSVAADFARDDLVGLISGAIGGFTATQHLSPNHVIEFDVDDSGRAVCYSSMYAQHYLAGAQDGDFFLLRGSYDNHLRRTPDGWRIERLIQHVSWPEGNENALTEVRGRVQ